jgi:hypothetical protein
VIELIDPAVPRMGRPSGVSPNSWAAKASCTVSEGSSSFMAISSRITPRSAATSFGSISELVTMSDRTSMASGRSASSTRA